MGRLEEQDFDEKRLARRNRRKKSQLIAYIVLAVFLVAVVAVVGVGVHFAGILLKQSSKQEAVEVAKEADSEVTQNIIIESPESITAEPQEMTETDLLDEIVESIISEMPLEDKVAGLFMVTPEQLTGVATVVKAGSSTQDALSQYAIGGLVYSSKNIKSQEQIAEMMKNTSGMSKYPLFTAIDEEISGTGAIASSDIGLELADVVDSDSAYNAGVTIASAMFKYGFNFDIAPEVDISESSIYGSDSETVIDMVTSFATALGDSGIFACAHAFPLSDEGTKTEMVTSEVSSDELVSSIYAVYSRLFTDSAVNAVMLSNVSFPAITGDNTPASLSASIIENELRGTLGFDGVVVSAPLNEGAITAYYTSAEAAINSIKAGADIIYMPENFEEAYEGVLEAVQNGSITEERLDESIKRIYRLKYADRVS